jgi:hypothetical protein
MEKEIAQKDWKFLIIKMPNTLKLIKQYALEKEDYEKLHLIQEIENLIKEKCSFCGGEHNLDSCSTYLTTITMG